MNPPKNTWWENASPDEQFRQQSSRLRWLIHNRIAPFHAYYKRMFEEHSINPDSIKTTDDLQRLPFTSKADFENPRDFVIIPDEEELKRFPSTYGRMFKVGPWNLKQSLQDELRPIFMTSTTGRSSEPVPFLYTKYDLANLEEGGRRMMQICDADPSYRIVNAFPFAPHLAFWQAHYAGVGHTTFVLSTGGGKTMGTAGNAKLITKINPDAIIAMPTFLYHLFQYAAEKNMEWTNLKRAVLGGEKVPLGMRRKLRKLASKLGSPDMDVISTYAFTEAKAAWTECPTPDNSEPSGYHIYPDTGFIEIVDPKTGERMPDGEGGEIVYSSLDSRGTVVLRYRTGDLSEHGITNEPCPYCHRTCPRLVGKISRVSEFRNLNIDKIKGTLVDFNQLEHILDDTDGLGAWQLELRKRNDDPLECDELIVHAVALNGGSDKLEQRIRRRLRNNTELSPNRIDLHTWDEIRELQGVGKELKEQKLVDHRPAS